MECLDQWEDSVVQSLPVWLLQHTPNSSDRLLVGAFRVDQGKSSVVSFCCDSRDRERGVFDFSDSSSRAIKRFKRIERVPGIEILTE